jgi:hypothetical protein
LILIRRETAEDAKNDHRWNTRSGGINFSSAILAPAALGRAVRFAVSLPYDALWQLSLAVLLRFKSFVPRRPKPLAFAVPPHNDAVAMFGFGGLVSDAPLPEPPILNDDRTASWPNLADREYRKE